MKAHAFMHLWILPHVLSEESRSLNISKVRGLNQAFAGKKISFTTLELWFTQKWTARATIFPIDHPSRTGIPKCK